MIKILFLLLSFSAFAQLRPYKIIILTDEEASSRAEEFRNYLLSKPPFEKMGNKLDLSVVKMSKEEMKCSNSMPDSPRIIQCDNSKLFAKQSDSRADLAVAFTSQGSGGAGGSIPIASMDYPIQTMFHEMLHTYGLDDEYDYSESERGVYCKNPVNSENMAYFKDTPPYKSDEEARSKHAKDIPWFGKIPANNAITILPALGSPMAYQAKGTQLAGLYRGGSCDSEKLPGWRPYLNSIMRGYMDDTIYPLYEEIIVKNIESSLGRKLDLPPPLNLCIDYKFMKGLEKAIQLNKESKEIFQSIEPNSNQHHHYH